MKTLEYHNNGNWIDNLLNSWPLCLDTDSIKPVLEIEYGANKSTPTKPDFKNLIIRTGNRCTTDSLFRNGLIYLRLTRPFGIFIHLRWCAFCRRAFLQTGFGWKLNGRIAVLLRIQSDQSAADGVHGHNFGQAVGFAEGNH